MDGWLSDLAAREMLIENDTLLDPGRRQLILDGTRADLTKLEFDVLQYLSNVKDGWSAGRRCCATYGATTGAAAATSSRS